MAQGVILSAGSVNVDVQVQAPRWPDPHETLPAERFALLGGGKAANVAYLARKLGHRAWLFGRVGDDVLADLALEPLRDAGVELRWVARAAGQHTGVALVVVHPDGRKGILLAENANLAWSDEALSAVLQAVERAPRSSVLTVDLELPERVAKGFVEAAHRCAMPVVLDPSPADRVPADILPMVSVATPNAGEAGKLCGRRVETDDDAREAALQICAMGVGVAIVKLGAGGCVIARSGRVEHLSGPGGAKPVDTTGAGDAFAGALSVALLEGRPVEEAARWGNAASAIAIGRFGSQPSYPDRGELKNVLRTGKVG